MDPTGQESERRSGRIGTPAAVLVFGLWTLFVWGGRLRNLWLDPGGFAEASRWSLVGSIVFTLLGLAVVAVWLANRLGSASNSSSGPGILRLVLWPLAGLTTVVWLLRAADISLGDHSIGFIVVHLVLAVVSVGLAVISVAALTRATVG